MTSLIEIPSPGESLHYGRPNAPLVIIAHDSFGRLPWLESYAIALADRGFRVSVPDFFAGFCTTDTATASELMAGIEMTTAIAIIDRVVERERERVSASQRVGVIGFAMGGRIALRYSQSGTPDATVSYYATLGIDEHAVIPIPLLLQLAETDQWAHGSEPAVFTERLRTHGTPVTSHTYLGTVHGFANATVTETADVRSAALAFARTAVFLQSHLDEALA